MENQLTPKELSEFLQVQLFTAYKWTHYDYMPHIKLDGVVRFKKNQTEKLLNQKAKN